MGKRVLFLSLLFLLYLFLTSNAFAASVSIPDTSVNTGTTVEVPLNIDSITNLAGFQLTVTYDPAVLQAAGSSRGDLTQPADWTIVHDTSTSGKIQVVAFDQTVAGVSGNNVSIVKLIFNAIGNIGDSTTLDFIKLKLTDINGVEIASLWNSGNVTISGDDNDGDGIPNDVDKCPDVSDPLQEDGDLDGVGNACDNCVSTVNADQGNADNDEYGNACEADDDNDSIPDSEETAIGTNPLNPDTDGDGVDDINDEFPLDGTEVSDSDKQERRITVNSGWQAYPDISANTIVWQDTRPENNGWTHVYKYDISTNGPEVRISTSDAGSVFPAISGQNVVWVRWTGSPNRNDIYKYNLSTGGPEVRFISSLYDQETPDISGERIVWRDSRNSESPYDIYLYDPSTGTTRFRPFWGEQHSPAISGDRVVWQDKFYGHWDIFMVDIVTGKSTRITTDPFDQTDPAISGNYIVWTDMRNEQADIYMYDISTGGPEVRITSEDAFQGVPAVSGTRIVWADMRSGMQDIYMYDIATNGPEVPIATGSWEQDTPAISGHKIVWMDSRHGHYDIYLYAGDGVGDNADNCPYVYNPVPQADADSDGIGDACDVCLNDPDNNCDTDSDGDGMDDSFELYYGVNDPNDDADNDGLTNLQESERELDPRDQDSDDDGVKDGIDQYSQDQSKVWTDDSVQNAITLINATHIIELRDAINNVRSVKGLPPYSWMNQTLTPQYSVIKALDISELRNALEDVIGQQVWVDDPIQAGITIIKTIHISQLRQRVEGAL